jgi:hypothetical protein
MKRIYWLAPIALLVAALACATPPTITPTPPITETVQPPTSTPTPTDVPTITPTQPTQLPFGGELVRNRSFEEFEYNVQNMTWDVAGDGYPHITPIGWQVGYHAENYFAETNPITYYGCANLPIGIPRPAQCDELDGAGRRWDDVDGRPEFKIGIPDRAHSGNASAYWFSYYRPAVGWFQQEIYLPINRTFDSECHAEFYQHWWITPGTTGLESLPPQPYATHDDRLAAFTLAQVGTGWVYREGDDALGSWEWRYPDVVFDHYSDEPYQFDFVVPHDVDRIVLQIGGQANWGWQTQDYALDDVSLRCRGIDFPVTTPEPATPTPVTTPNPNGTPVVVTPMGGDAPLGTAIINVATNMRVCDVQGNEDYPIYWFADHNPVQDCPVLYLIPAGTVVRVSDFYRDINGDLWMGFLWDAETEVEVAVGCLDDQQRITYYHHWLGSVNNIPVLPSNVCGF